MSASTWIVLLKHSLTVAERERVSALLRTLASDVGRTEDGYGHNGLGSWWLGGFRHPVFGLAPGVGLAPERVSVAADTMSEATLLERFDEERREYLTRVGLLDDREQYTSVLGFFPQQRLVCDVPHAGRVSIRLLGHVVVHLAAWLDGYVDCNNDPAFPPLHPERVDVEPVVSSLFMQGGGLTPRWPSGPGHVFEIYSTPYHGTYVQVASDGKTVSRIARTYSTIMDAEFFRRWFETGFEEWLDARVG